MKILQTPVRFYPYIGGVENYVCPIQNPFKKASWIQEHPEGNEKMHKMKLASLQARKKHFNTIENFE